MISTCKCGGRVAPHNFNPNAPVARFRCDKCGKRYSQRKRQPTKKAH